MGLSQPKKKKKKKKKKKSGKTVLGCFDVLGKGTNIENK
jgi:hypothetical protein